MKNLKISTIALFTLLMSAGIQTAQAAKDKEIKLTTTYDEMIVDVSPEEAWEVLKSYGNVGAYHSGVKDSKSVNGSMNEASMGCERECTLENGRKEIVIIEKIMEYKEGEYYKYEVTESEGFSIQKFYNTFGVKQNDMGQTVIYVRSEFRLDPGIMTGLAKGKLARGNHQALISYKHYMETGERNADAKALKKMYKHM